MGRRLGLTHAGTKQLSKLISGLDSLRCESEARLKAQGVDFEGRLKRLSGDYAQLLSVGVLSPVPAAKARAASEALLPSPTSSELVRVKGQLEDLEGKFATELEAIKAEAEALLEEQAISLEAKASRREAELMSKLVEAQEALSKAKAISPLSSPTNTGQLLEPEEDASSPLTSPHRPASASLLASLASLQADYSVSQKDRARLAASLAKREAAIVQLEELLAATLSSQEAVISGAVVSGAAAAESAASVAATQSRQEAERALTLAREEISGLMSSLASRTSELRALEERSAKLEALVSQFQTRESTANAELEEVAAALKGGNSLSPASSKSSTAAHSSSSSSSLVRLAASYFSRISQAESRLVAEREASSARAKASATSHSSAMEALRGAHERHLSSLTQQHNSALEKLREESGTAAEEWKMKLEEGQSRIASLTSLVTHIEEKCAAYEAQATLVPRLQELLKVTEERSAAAALAASDSERSRSDLASRYAELEVQIAAVQREGRRALSRVQGEREELERKCDILERDLKETQLGWEVCREELAGERASTATLTSSMEASSSASSAQHAAAVATLRASLEAQAATLRASRAEAGEASQRATAAEEECKTLASAAASARSRAEAAESLVEVSLRGEEDARRQCQRAKEEHDVVKARLNVLEAEERKKDEEISGLRVRYEASLRTASETAALRDEAVELSGKNARRVLELESELREAKSSLAVAELARSRDATNASASASVAATVAAKERELLELSWMEESKAHTRELAATEARYAAQVKNLQSSLERATMERLEAAREAHERLERVKGESASALAKEREALEREYRKALERDLQDSANKWERERGELVREHRGEVAGLEAAAAQRLLAAVADVQGGLSGELESVQLALSSAKKREQILRESIKSLEAEVVSLRSEASSMASQMASAQGAFSREAERIGRRHAEEREEWKSVVISLERAVEDSRAGADRALRGVEAREEDMSTSVELLREEVRRLKSEVDRGAVRHKEAMSSARAVAEAAEAETRDRRRELTLLQSALQTREEELHSAEKEIERVRKWAAQELTAAAAAHSGGHWEERLAASTGREAKAVARAEAAERVAAELKVTAERLGEELSASANERAGLLRLLREEAAASAPHRGRQHPRSSSIGNTPKNDSALLFSTLENTSSFVRAHHPAFQHSNDASLTPQQQQQQQQPTTDMRTLLFAAPRQTSPSTPSPPLHRSSTSPSHSPHSPISASSFSTQHLSPGGSHHSLSNTSFSSMNTVSRAGELAQWRRRTASILAAEGEGEGEGGDLKSLANILASRSGKPSIQSTKNSNSDIVGSVTHLHPHAPPLPHSGSPTSLRPQSQPTPHAAYLGVNSLHRNQSSSSSTRPSTRPPASRSLSRKSLSPSHSPVGNSGALPAPSLVSPSRSASYSASLSRARVRELGTAAATWGESSFKNLSSSQISAKPRDISPHSSPSPKGELSLERHHRTGTQSSSPPHPPSLSSLPSLTPTTSGPTLQLRSEKVDLGSSSFRSAVGGGRNLSPDKHHHHTSPVPSSSFLYTHHHHYTPTSPSHSSSSKPLHAPHPPNPNPPRSHFVVAGRVSPTGRVLGGLRSSSPAEYATASASLSASVAHAKLTAEAVSSSIPRRINK